MKNKFVFLFLLIMGICMMSCSKKMVFTVDLTGINQDKLEVSLEVPKLRMDTLIYSFPAIIPGHYNQVNYGRFIDSLSAYDKAGRMLVVDQQNTNQWMIHDASKLDRIIYFVDDTEDAEVEALVYPWAATNFRKDELFVLNNGGLFGYFEGMEDLSYSVHMHIPEMLHPSSSLEMNNLENNWVDFTSAGYFDLIDCPVLLAKADTASFFLDQTKVTIACANEAKVPVASYLSSRIKEHLSAVQKFAQRELPVSEYTYLINLRDYSDYSDYVYNKPLSLELFMKMFETHGRPMPGALEHNTSSYHHYLYMGRKESLMDLMDVSIIHEFLHIYTPLHLHSELTGDFDYNQDKITQHIWLYEGVTEYFAGLVKLQGGMMQLDDYLQDIVRFKMITGSYFPKDMKWTELSRNIYHSPYKEQFMQFYQQGAINALMLDIEIIDLTDGAKTLKSVVFDLIEEYGKERSFLEDEFFEVFTEHVHPDLISFFDKHIRDTVPVDYEEQLAKIGIGFKLEKQGMVPSSILSGAMGVSDVIEAFGYYSINESSEKSIFKPGDKIRSKDFGNSCLRPFITPTGFISETESVEIPVYRNNEWIKLRVVPEWEEGTYKYRVYEMKSKTPRQERLFNAWRNPISH